MSDGGIRCSWAVLGAVPHPHLGDSVPVGVVLLARTEEFLDLRVVTDESWLARRVPDADVPLLARYLESCRAMARGDEKAGPVALYPPSERFHWITAPRSDVIQPSRVREARCADPAAELETLFRRHLGTDAPGQGVGPPAVEG